MAGISVETKCDEHSGNCKSILVLEQSDKNQWDKLSALDQRINGIMTRLNVTLGGLAVSLILLAVNLFK